MPLLLRLKLLIGLRVEQNELLVMERRIGAEGQATGILLLDAHQKLFVLSLEAVQHFGINDNPDIVDIRFFAKNRVQGALNFVTHRHRTLYYRAAVALWANHKHRAGEAFLGS